MIKPMTSFAVVINGPVANAASILKRFNSNGTNVPNSEAKMITTRRETATVIVTNWS